MSERASTRRRKRRRVIGALIARDGGLRCFYCKTYLRPWTTTLDHIIPLSLGGTNELGNLRLACQPCNNERGAPEGEIYSAQEAVW